MAIRAGPNNGDPADSNAALFKESAHNGLFKEGTHNGFDSAGVKAKAAKEHDTPGWSASNAQNEMQQAITALGTDGFAGVYAANDDTAGGCDRSDEKGGSIRPKSRPPARTRPWPACSGSSPGSST